MPAALPNPASAAPAEPSAAPASLVDVFVGTQAGREADSNTYAGDTYPGASRPFGMVSWSPDTPLWTKADGGRGYQRDRDGGYAYEENTIRGFSLTHFNGAGCGGAAGDLPFLPYAGALAASPAVDSSPYYAHFSHANETASPGYYKVRTDDGITTELTATQRSGLGKIAYPAGKPATLLIDTAESAMGTDGAGVTIDPATRTVSGWAASGHFCWGPNTYKIYFTATFDEPFAGYGTWQDGDVKPSATSAEGGNLTPGRFDQQQVKATGGSGAYLNFKPGSTVHARVGISYVSAAGAAANLRSEQAGRSFGEIRAAAAKSWNDQLGRIAIRGGSTGEQTTFYTALYHSLLQPNLFSDADGQYTGFDNKVHRAKPGHAQYATFSGWDMYRTQVQLLALIAPHEAADIAQSMLNQATQAGGIWDRWSQNNDFMGVMGGDPFHAVVSTMYAFGATDFDARAALTSMVRGATRVQSLDERFLERPGLEDYQNLGYHPGNVSDLLEDTTADFAISQLAARLGSKDVAKRFAERSQYWQNVYDPGTGYLRARGRDGQWIGPFDPAKHHEMRYQEGNAAQYTWMVPYNVGGLVTAMGGRDAVTTRLDSFFTELNTDADTAKAWMANEPSFEVPWEYLWTGAPAKTQDVVRRSAELLFHPTPDGLPGNDDVGTTSAWYVWAALGMYPELPGRSELVLASPLFPDVTIHRPGGQVLRITAPAASSTNRYVQALTVDGRASSKPWLPESFAQNGGRVNFTLGASPTTWGSAPADAPPSFRSGEVPVRGSVSPGRVSLAPGSSAKATVRAEAITGSGSVRWAADPPAGVTVTPARGSLRAGQSATVTVRATGGARYTRVPITFSGSGAAQRPSGVDVTVAPAGSLMAAYDNSGVTGADRPWYSEFGSTERYGGGYAFAYSAEALATAGVKPGSAVPGTPFVWPSFQPGEPSNVTTGATIAVPPRSGATSLSFLGSASEGTIAQHGATGTVRIAYTDGSTQDAVIGLSDWLSGNGSDQPAYGNTVAISTPVVNSAFPRYIMRVQRGYTAKVYATAPIPLAAGKTVASITLPSSWQGGGKGHVFTYALS
ncbi:MAG: hypothetical protein QOD41_2008 [Cryptosporangiaceae bacterium]|nr:hypothetical protein [Cryptosporangiaceae bacterium]